MFKDFLVCLDPGVLNDIVSKYAASAAAVFGAHVAGLAFAYEPAVPDPVVAVIPPEVLDKPRRENKKVADFSVSHFEDVARGASLSFSSHIVTAPFPSAVNLAAVLARRFDLTLIRQEATDDAGRQNQLIESILFNSGRPLIVVPYIQRDEMKLDRVMVCWDNGQYAARAVAEAMPILTRAQKVEVVTVENGKTAIGEVPGTGIGEHLARHGVNVAFEKIVAPEVDVADTLLSHAADASITFMVMGGYGHSRFREIVLGGVTREILESMTVPTLMTH
jgi:nucleotide-binding universal stress UspA family protein